jgi:hypothetical protein
MGFFTELQNIVSTDQDPSEGRVSTYVSDPFAYMLKNRSLGFDLFIWVDSMSDLFERLV